MKLKTILYILCSYTLIAQSSTQYSGYVHLYDIHRLSDRSIIHLPWRIFRLNVDHQRGDFAFNSTLAMEYKIREDDSFFSSSDPQEFTWDLRELYASWFTSFGEIKVGKQIHSWSSVDDNSPIDNINAYDYYYIFNLGSDRKYSSLGLTLDYYLNNTKLGFYYSPLHHTNRLPINDPEFPIQLPVTPRASQIISPNNPDEYGITLQQKMNVADLSFTYFSGYDRLFSLSGSNVFTNQFQTMSVLDTVFSFRKTDMIGAGIVIPTKWIILRAEYAQFSTFDNNDSTSISNKGPSRSFGSANEVFFSHAFETKAKYYQTILQLETELPGGIEFIGQYFKYDTLSFDAEYLPDVDLPLLEAEFDPYSVFFPGMGTPLAIMANEAIIMIFNKSFLNEQLLFETLFLFDYSDFKYESLKKLNTFQDVFDNINLLFDNLDGKGQLIEFKTTYDLSNSLKVVTALTHITGNSKLDDDYTFNEMEDFSHIRFELKYFF